MRIWVLQIFILLGFLTSCNKEDNPIITPKDIWDIDKDGIPKFVNTNYIELAGIYRISKFRSSVGHDYSDRGVYSRANVIIPKEVRDANPLNCNGDTFTTTDTLENWIYLN